MVSSGSYWHIKVRVRACLGISCCWFPTENLEDPQCLLIFERTENEVNESFTIIGELTLFFVSFPVLKIDDQKRVCEMF